MEQQDGQLIWAGRLHLGDEPGTFGDATYAGLCIDLPVTLDPFDEPQGRADDIRLVVAAEHLGTLGQIPRHRVSLYAFESRSRQTAWIRSRIAGPVHFEGRSARLEVGNIGGHRHFAVRVEVDTSAAPGLYNDFVLVALTLHSTTHYAEFGFRAGRRRPG